MAEKTADIVTRAEQLALSLTSGPAPVKRNVLLGLTSDFLTDPRPDRERLLRTVRLIAKGSGGHIKRGGGYGEQVRTAAVELAQVLNEDLSDQDLKSLLGWTARLLLVRRVPGEQASASRTVSAPGRPKEGKPPDPPREPGQNPVLGNVLLKLDRGTATAFRGDKSVASCRPESLDPEIHRALKDNKKGIRADVEVVKVGRDARIVGVTIR